MTPQEVHANIVRDAGAVLREAGDGGSGLADAFMAGPSR